MYSWGRDDNDSLGAATPSPLTAIMAPAPPQQWGPEETKELIRIRADAERGSASPARSKALWEAVGAAMLRRGFARTPEQCKCKWKSLLNRYKGKETSDSSNGRECPFFDELHALFNERARKMQRLLLETETGSPSSGKKAERPNAGPPSDELSENEEEEKDDSDEEAPARSNARKRKAERGAPRKPSKTPSSESGVVDMLEEFFRQQIRMEKQWAGMMDRRAREQMLFEQERRRYMEKLERERLASERAWREMEEQRRARDESRAERRDELLTTLLKSLIDD